MIFADAVSPLTSPNCSGKWMNLLKGHAGLPTGLRDLPGFYEERPGGLQIWTSHT
jgi:hypothetical protein